MLDAVKNTDISEYEAYSGWTRLPDKAKSNADRTLRSQCVGDMEGWATHSSAEVSPERTGTKGPFQPMQSGSVEHVMPGHEEEERRGHAGKKSQTKP